MEFLLKRYGIFIDIYSSFFVLLQEAKKAAQLIRNRFGIDEVMKKVTWTFS